MAKVEVKDVSRERISFDRSGDKQQDWDEEYVVVRGDVELWRTRSRIEAERFAARLTNTKARQKLREGSQRELV